MGWRTNTGNNDDGNGRHGEQKRERWDRQQRKATNRRERDDVNRGHWELTEPLTTDEEYELRNLNDFDNWEEVTTGDKKNGH